jgi:hypothetical protein
MARRLLALLVALLTVLPLTSVAKMRDLSPCEEREQALDYARSLEDHPLAKDNLEKRMWLTEWLVKTPVVTVSPCCKELSSLDEVNNTYSYQLRMQAIYSQAAFQIEHPTERDPAVIQAAGLSGTLRAYRAIQRFDPSAKYPLLDDLMGLEKKGKLEKYIQQQWKSMEE